MKHTPVGASTARLSKHTNPIKKTLCLLLSLVMLLSITAGLDWFAYAATSGDYEYTICEDGTAAITGYNGLGGDITIPSRLNSHTVTDIEGFAFNGCTKLKGVTIPNSVTSIGWNSFGGCKNLTRVKIGSGVTYISGAAFQGCIQLQSIAIPGKVAHIDTWAFSGCSSLANINVDSNNKNYSSLNGVLFDKAKTKLIIYPEGKKGTSYSIPKSVTSIGDSTFEGCNSLTSVIIPDSVTCIDWGAFSDCSSLKNVYYTGSKEQWNRIEIGEENECLTKATIHYNHTHSYKTTTTKATTKKNGVVVTRCSVCRAVKSKSTIYYAKTIKLSSTSYIYNGKVRKPTLTVKDSKGKKISSKYYTVSYSKGRKNVGKYTVTVKFKGNYSGTVKKTFTIKPKATSISSLTSKSKGFTVKRKKQATQTTGYQIQYATNSKFTKNKKTVTVSKNKTTSKKISNLKAKKKYYVRVRTYKTVNGKKIYSSWSKAKTVKTK